MSVKRWRKALLSVFSCAVFVFISIVSVQAQTEAELKEAMTKGMALVEEGRLVEAVPYLKTIVAAVPDEPKLRFIYGLALLSKSKQIDGVEEAKTLSAESLKQFLAAKQLGLKDERNEAFIRILNGETGESSVSYSKNAEANKLMQQAEGYFARSEYDEAYNMYQKVLSLDPNVYEAALYSGDVFTKKEDWANAEKWYQKAIAINPGRETAYRYSATPLMKQQKYEQARDRYIEAFITEPYSQMSPRGISQWAQITGAKLGHPAVDIPEIKIDANGKATTVMNENSLTDASKAWLAYVLTRESWRKEKFAKTFPAEKAYRHSLQEEAEAIRSTLKSAKEQNLTNSQFEILQKLDNEGLLEAYILMAQPDQGIARDHENYLKANRAKLRQYVLNYVIQK